MTPEIWIAAFFTSVRAQFPVRGKAPCLQEVIVDNIWDQVLLPILEVKSYLTIFEGKFLLSILEGKLTLTIIKKCSTCELASLLCDLSRRCLTSGLSHSCSCQRAVDGDINDFLCFVLLGFYHYKLKLF